MSYEQTIENTKKYIKKNRRSFKQIGRTRDFQKSLDIAIEVANKTANNLGVPERVSCDELYELVQKIYNRIYENDKNMTKNHTFLIPLVKGKWVFLFKYTKGIVIFKSIVKYTKEYAKYLDKIWYLVEYA